MKNFCMREDLRSKEELLHEIAVLREHVTGLDRSQATLSTIRRQDAARLAMLSRLNPNPVVEVDSSGKVSFFNQALKDVLDRLGFTEEDVTVFVPEDLMELFTKNENNIVKELAIKDRVFNQNICFAPEYDAACIYIYDITKYNRAEQKNQKLISVIRSERDKLSTLINSIQDEVWFTNTRKRTTLANPVARRESGLTIFTGPVNIKDVDQNVGVYRLDGTLRQLEQSPAIRALRGETISNEIEQVRDKDGHTRYREVSAAPVRGANNKIMGSVSVIRDITERKNIEEALRSAHEELELRVKQRTEQLQNAYQSLISEIEERKKLEERLRQSQKMEAIGTLAGGIAHDFNNILAGIIGFSEMIEEDLPEGSPLKGYINNVLKASFRGRDLVKQILAFSRKTEHTRQTISLSPLIKETIKLLRSSLPSTVELNLDIKLQNDCVHASAIELQQIVMNLVTNAARAIGNKGGAVRICLTDAHFAPDSPESDSEFKSGGEYLELMVKDTGSGMTPDVMSRIFEPFYTTHGLGGGTGMGLAVVYGIVKSLKGVILVESEPREGSIFRIFLPKESQLDDNENASSGENIFRGNERVLFVDDEKLLVDLNAELLKKLGYRVTAMTDSVDALDKFLSDPFAFDVVVTDQTMPKMDGLMTRGEITGDTTRHAYNPLYGA
jgi:PAS domain S-box-containing protein